MKNVIVLLLCSFIICNAFVWDDCGTPLTRWVSYESVTISPSDNIDVQAQLSINILATISQTVLAVDTINTQVLVWKDGVLFLNATTRPLCTLLAANSQGCTLTEGQKISYTYQWDVPSMPRGNYSVRVLSTSALFEQEVGCLAAETTVDGLTTPNSCVYTSTFSAAISGALQFQVNKFSQSIGDFIQVGPYGAQVGGVASTASWGTFTAISGTSDIVGTSTVDASNYVWGVNGTMVNQTVGAISTHRYTGLLVVGYAFKTGTYAGTTQFVVGGSFDWTFLSDPAAQTYNLQSGSLELTYNQPFGFLYPVVLGNLNSLTLGTASNGIDTSITASRQWCTCGTCATVSSLDSFIRTQSSSNTGGSGLSLLENGTIAVGVVGAVAMIAAVIVLVVYFKSARQPIYDPAEMVYPSKPDYGSMALGEIIDEDSHHRV